MSDTASTARTARESLARGLAALQSDPNVPPALMELAAPIAQSMGALHQIEKSNGAQIQPHASMALENVRMALSKLQAHPPTHPAVNAAMEAVASSLGLVHALSKLAAPQGTQPIAAQPAAAAPAPAPAQGGFPQQAPRPNVAPMAQTVAAPQGGYGAAAAPAPQPYAAPQQMAPQQMAPQQMAPQQPYAPPQQQMAPQQPYGAPPQQMAPQQPYAPPPQQMAPQQMAPQAAAPMPAGMARDPFAAPGAAAPAPAPGDKLLVTADLGAQSPTNFYKGLSGNDIVDHGGLFVSTYMIPKIGTPIRLRVALPGGYEFEADAVVRWARDVRDASSDAPPGFGAQFTQIAQEARQLIYRYVRNREPMFHDDL